MEIRTTSDLNLVLREELALVRTGKALPSRTNAIARAVAQITGLRKLEQDEARLKYQLGKAQSDVVVSAIEF